MRGCEAFFLKIGKRRRHFTAYSLTGTPVRPPRQVSMLM